jgi:hypothetical protein
VVHSVDSAIDDTTDATGREVTARIVDAAGAELVGATAEVVGAGAEVVGAAAKLVGAAAEVVGAAAEVVGLPYLGSQTNLSPSEEHSFSSPLSKRINHRFSPLDSIIVPCILSLFLRFT